MEKESFFKYIFNKEEKEKLQEITNQLPENKICAEEILEQNGNNTTKIILDGGLKNSYYLYINDTIYLSNRERNKRKYTRICLIAHECVHSLQSKILQRINFILSNIELISFAIVFILSILNIGKNYTTSIYAAIVVLSIIPRLILEIDAVLKSIPFAKKYLQSKLDGSDAKLLTKVYSFQTKIFLPVFLLLLFLSKIIRILVIYYLNKI